MTKTYTLGETGSTSDDQKTITIVEVKEVTEERQVTVAQLKQEHDFTMSQIEALKTRANEIVQMINDIDTNTDLTIKDKPTKLTK